MARFSLAMNGKRINSLDDLRSNFNANQMLGFYKTKRLQKWLEEQGLNDELENINSFEPDYGDDTLLSKLMAVFELSDEQISVVTKQTEKQDESSGQDATTQEKVAVAEWEYCCFKSSRLTDTIEATSKKIENPEQLKAHSVELELNMPFYFNGFFYAWTSSSKVPFVAYKSADLKTWHRDETLTNAKIEWYRVSFGDKHCFLWSKDRQKIAFCSKDEETWQKTGLNMPCGWESIEDIFEKDGFVGLVYICNNDHTNNNGLLICENFFDEEKREYKKMRVSNSVRNGVFFKDKCLCIDRNGEMQLSKISEWKFTKVKNFDYSFFNHQTLFVFNDKAFIEVCSDFFPGFSRCSTKNLFYSDDGEKWTQVELMVERKKDEDDEGKVFRSMIFGVKKENELKILSVTCFKNDYYALVIRDCCMFGGGNGAVYKSSNGKDWDLFADNIGNCSTMESSLVAGNEKLFCYRRGDYFIYSENGSSTSSSSTETTAYLESAKKISSQVKSFLAKELHMDESEITDDSDVVQDLHADPLQVKLWGYQLGELLGVKFPENAIPGKVIDIVSFALKNKTPQK